MPIPPSSNCAPPKGYTYLGVDVDSGQTSGSVEAALERWEYFKDITDSTQAISFSDSYSVGWLPFYLQNIAIPREAISYVWWRPLTYSLTARKIVPIDIKNLSKGANIGGFSTDKLILETAMLCASLNQHMLISPAPDMNHYDVPWCAFDKNKKPRAHTTQDYINMFRRIVILAKGGTVATINSRLDEYDLEHLDTNWTSNFLPSPTLPGATYVNADKLNFVFSAGSFSGNPDIEENHWSKYYPGDEFVDWVGQSIYETNYDVFDDLNAFYNEFNERDKPYIISNWQLTKDDPFFVDSLLFWAQKNDNVQGIVYKNHPYPLEKFRNALSRYKIRARDTRFLPNVYLNQELAPWGWIHNPPAGQTLTGTVGVMVRSYDEDKVTRVEYFVDGEYRYTDRVSPSIFWWNTALEENGFHRIGIRVFDTDNNPSSMYETTYKTEN